MTKVPAINVLVSSERKILLEAMEDLGNARSSLQDIVNRIQNVSDRAGILLFNNEANPNFISLEHSLLGNEFKAVLKFIDPRGEFETNYLSTGSIYRALLAASQKANRAPKTKDSKETSKSADASKLGYKVIEKIVQKNSQKPIYIAYGIGDDSSTWSSVHRMEMANIAFSPDKSREFTLTLIANPLPLSITDRRGAYNQTVDLNTFGQDLAGEGVSKRIRFENASEGGPKVYGFKDGKYGEMDYHLLVVDTINDYMRKVTGGANIVTLLPDLNELLRYHIGRKKAEITFKEDSQAANLLLEVSQILNDLKMTMPCADRQPKFEEIPVEVASLKKATLNTTGDLTDIATRIFKSKQGRANEHFKARDYKAKITTPNSDKGVPDLIKPVADIFNAINKYSAATYTFSPTYLTESDSRLIEYWGSEEQASKFTFNGREDFNPDKRTIVIGDPTLIQNLLFPKEGQDPLPPNIVYEVNANDLTQDNYKSGINRIIEKSVPASVFGDLYQAPDVFQYADDVLGVGNISDIQRFKIPVFRHNTSNPNVISIKHTDETTAYLPVMKAVYRRQVERVAVNLSSGKADIRLNDFRIIDTDQLKAAIQRSRYSDNGTVLTKKQIIDDIVNRVDGSLKETLLKEGGEEQIVKAIKSYMDELDGNEELVFKISQEVNANPAELIEKYASELSNQVTRVTVKTVPLFSISTKSVYHMSPAVVFSQDVPMLGQVFPRRTRFNNYLTGLYRILGFKHTLTSSNAESLFVLARVNDQTKVVDPVGENETEPLADEMTYSDYEDGESSLPGDLGLPIIVPEDIPAPSPGTELPPSPLEEQRKEFVSLPPDTAAAQLLKDAETERVQEPEDFSWDPGAKLRKRAKDGGDEIPYEPINLPWWYTPIELKTDIDF